MNRNFAVYNWEFPDRIMDANGRLSETYSVNLPTLPLDTNEIRYAAPLPQIALNHRALHQTALNCTKLP